MEAATLTEARRLREEAALVGDEIDQAIADGTITGSLTAEQAYGLMVE